MSDLKAALGHKVAGLPAGAWAAAILGGLGVSWYLRNRNAGAPVDTGQTVAPGEADTPGLGGAAVSDPSNPGNVSNPAGPGGPGQAAKPIRNNNQWRQQMIKVMVGNHHTPLASARAVDAYLRGSQLSEREAAALNQAMAVVGPPPLPTPPATVRKDPPPKPKKKKKHTPIAHKADKPARHHTHPKPHPHARRDTGGHTNPGR